MAVGLAAAVVVAGVGVASWLVSREDAPAHPLDIMAYERAPVATAAFALSDLFTESATAEIEASQATVFSITNDRFIVSGTVPVDIDSESPVYRPRVAAVSRLSGELLWAIESDLLTPRDLLDSFSFHCQEFGAGLLCAATDYGSARRTQLTIIDPADGSATSMKVEGGFDYSLLQIGGGVLLSRPGESDDYEMALVDPRTGVDMWTADVGPGLYGSTPSGYAFGGYIAISEADGEDSENEITTLRSVESGVTLLTVQGWIDGSGWNGDASIILERGEYDEDNYTWHGFSRLELNGQVLWSEPDLDLAGSGDVGDPVFGQTPYVEDGEDRDLVALDPQDAHELWRYDLGSSVGGYVWDVVDNTLIYSDFESERVLLLNKTTGAKLSSPDGYILGSGEGMAYFQDDDELSAHDLTTGDNLWRIEQTSIASSIDEESAQIYAADGYLVLQDLDEIRILLPAG